MDNVVNSDILSNLYYTPSYSSALGGVKNLTNKAKRVRKMSSKNVVNWLKSQDPYTLHKPVRSKFPRRSTIVSGRNIQLQADLIDVQKYQDENDGNHFLLTAIDVFSKKAWVFPAKSKSGKDVSKVLEVILENQHFKYIQTDKGKEFLNVKVQNMLERHNIKHFTSENESIKCAVVERFNRTLQQKLHHYFTYSRTYRYIDILPEIVAAYNNTTHSSINMAPNEVNKDNQEDVWIALYHNPIRLQKPEFQKDDYVRITKSRWTFNRGYTPNWSEEIFQIVEARDTTPIVYTIRDLNNEPIVGTFYQAELQLVTRPESFKIEKIIKSKKLGKKTMYFVKWLNYPDTFNQWIDSTDFVS